MNKQGLSTEKSREQLSEEVIAGFKDVVADAEALLKATADQGGDKLTEVRTRTEKSLKAVKARMAEAQDELLARTKAAAKVTDTYVHDNPWQAVGIGAGVGFLIGLLIGRR